MKNVHFESLEPYLGLSGAAVTTGLILGTGIGIIAAELWKGYKWWTSASSSEPATILFDYLPDENTIGEVLWFGRNLMSTYAHLLPILFLSTVVICLWCVSSIKPLNVSVARFTLALTYLFLLGFYCVYFMNVNSYYLLF